MCFTLRESAYFDLRLHSLRDVWFFYWDRRGIDKKNECVILLLKRTQFFLLSGVQNVKYDFLFLLRSNGRKNGNKTSSSNAPLSPSTEKFYICIIPI